MNRSQPIQYILYRWQAMGMPHTASVLISMSTDPLKTNGTQLVDILSYNSMKYPMASFIIKIIFREIFQNTYVQCKPSYLTDCGDIAVHIIRKIMIMLIRVIIIKIIQSSPWKWLRIIFIKTKRRKQRFLWILINNVLLKFPTHPKTFFLFLYLPNMPLFYATFYDSLVTC